MVKIKGVKVYVSNGKTYAYHRESGRRLKSPYASPQFYVELLQIDNEFHGVQPSQELCAWGQLVAAYTASAKFQQELSQRTKEDYLSILDWLDPLNAMELKDWTRGFVVSLRDKAHSSRNWRFANYVVTVVSVVFTWAVKADLYPEAKHPVRKVDKVKRPKDMPDANRPWTDEEWSIVINRASKHMRAALMLCGVLGWREGEAISRPRKDYNPQARMIRRVASKSYKVVETPVPDEVADALDALFPHDGVTLLVNSRNKPWTSAGFRSSFFRLIRTLEGENLVDPGLTVHGLRHTVATRLREKGYDLDTIKDMLGQNTLGMAEHYSKRADLRKKLGDVVTKL